MLDPYAAPPATLCDPHQTRDLNPAWSCDVPGCDCGSTPSALGAERQWFEELADELRLRYELLDLERELDLLEAEARRIRDRPWLRLLRLLRRAMG